MREIYRSYHDKYITTPEFNRLWIEFFNVWLKQANLVTKTDFDDKIKSQDQKINTNKTKYLLKMKTTDIWFNLFLSKKSFRRRSYTKLLSISANAKMF